MEDLQEEILFPIIKVNDDFLKEIEKEKEQIIDGNNQPEINEEYKRHYEVLKEKGYLYLPEDYEFKGDIEDMYQKHIENLEKETVESIINDIPYENKEIIKYLVNGGTNIKEFLEKTTNETIDISTEDKQKEFITSHLIKTGIDEVMAKATVETVALTGDLEKYANNFKTKIETEKSEQLKQANLELEKQKQQQKQQQQLYLQNLTKAIEEEKWDVSKKEQIFNAITNKDPKLSLSNKMNEINKNPKHLIQLAVLLENYDSRDGFKLDKVVETQVVKETKKTLDEIFKPVVRSGQSQKPNGEDLDPSKFKLFKNLIE